MHRGWLLHEGGKGYTLAERWNGSAWSIQSTVDPGTVSDRLIDVSCLSSTSCIAIGPKGTGETFPEQWNGTSWSIISTPKPEGAESSYLSALSCTAATACTAAGSYSFKRENKEWASNETVQRTLAMRFNGTSWSIQSTPEASDGKEFAKLKDVVCTSSSSCSAVGSYATKRKESPSFNATEEKTLALSWNGSEWAVQPTPNPEGKTFSDLRDISCSAQGTCTAVGAANAEGASVTLAERDE